MREEHHMEASDAGPPTLNHVIGQQRAVEQLRVAVDAHFNDRMAGHGKAFPHTLLVGPPGVGKTAIAKLIGRELAATVREQLAQNIPSPRELQGLLVLVDESDVVFLDEIHELPGNTQTTLYRALEEGRLFLRRNRQTLQLPAFTFIGATTDEWSLAKPLRDRFKLVLRLEHYAPDELAKLVQQRGQQLGWNLASETVEAIARRGRGVPRIAIRILDAARRVSRAEDADAIALPHLERACQIEGIDQIGLDPLERQYLQILREAEGPLRLNVLATRLGLPRRTIETVIETELIRLGMVDKTERGRVLTAAGADHLAKSV